MTDTDRLAALLAADESITPAYGIVHASAAHVAARLITAGVTLDPRPARDTALREAAQAVVDADAAVIKANEWDSEDDIDEAGGVYEDAIRALRAALEAEA